MESTEIEDSALRVAVAQSRRAQGLASAARALVRAWEGMHGYRGAQGRRGRALRRTAVPPLLAALERLGLGAFRTDLSPTELRRPGLAAMAEVVERLGVDARFVLFGHLHRPGPLAGDGEAWRTAGGVRLANTGSWVYEPAYLGATPGDTPYWPGTMTLVRDGGPPELRHLLQDLDHGELGHGR